LVIVRWLGKRMSGQLTVLEMAVLLTLGAIVSVPMQTPDRGILQGLILLLCAVSFQRGISYLGYRSHKIENILQGKPSMLVKDGLLQLDQMRKDRISRQVLFAQIRQQSIYNLGAVQRVYLEACGLFSIYREKENKPGLPIYPPDDRAVTEPGVAEVSFTNEQACTTCGKVVTTKKEQTCPNCGENEFTTAIK
jgi:uncharacterized membrane protein YcaP (DUF421 family)